MSDSLRYKLLFRGEIEAPLTRSQGLERLAKLFKLSRKQVEALFDGQTRPLKQGMNKLTASKYQAAFKQAGLRAYLKIETHDNNKNNDRVSAKSPPANLELAPAKGNLLQEHERALLTTANIDTNHLSTSRMGESLGASKLKAVPVITHIEHLQLAKAGSLLSPQKTIPITADINTKKLKLSDLGVTLQNTKHEDATPPDTSHLTVESKPAIL